MPPKTQNVQKLDAQQLDKKMPDTLPEGTRPAEDNWRFDFKWGRINFSLQRKKSWLGLGR